jgi:hypothetical protein
MIEVKCPKCRERLAGYLVPFEKALACRYWNKEENEGAVILAKGTTIKLVKPWRQQKRDVFGKKQKRAARWLAKHDIRIATTHHYRNDYCVAVNNHDNNSADSACLCDIPEDVYELGGPGAQAHIDEDRVPLLEIHLEEEKKAREKAEAEAEDLAIARRIDKQLARFEKLGIKARRSTGFPGMRTRSISMDPDEIERVLLTLERYVEMMNEKKAAEAEGEAEADTTTH